jgi:type IV secretory pathway VirB9-like protein
MRRTVFLLSLVLVAADAMAYPHYRQMPHHVGTAPAKVVAYGERDVVSVHAKIRFSTLIVLPKNERILDFICGDKEMWIVNGSQNFASVKPAKVGSQTNLDLITASGNVYSFVLTEVSDEPQVPADVKIFIVTKEESMMSAASSSPKFVSAEELAAAKQQIVQAQEETRKVKGSTQSEIDSGISAFIQNVRFPYRFEAGKKPFFVRAMYTNDRFTYIQARPEETPTIYEIKDGKPNLVNFDYQNGLYVVNKVLEDGYLVIGKQKLTFSKQD